MSAVLQLDRVSRVYGSGQTAVTALDDVSLAVDRGEMVAIMGPSGSGKSTLLGIAGGLDKPTSGDVTVSGVALADLTPTGLAQVRRQRLGFVFQDFNLVPTLTAIENVALPLELDGSSVRDARAHADAALDRVGIADLADRYVEQMSGGQRQRVAIARATVGERRLLLADEPTGALDSRTGDELMATLRDMVDVGIAVVVVTHEARHAGWADRVVFLRDGRIIDETRSQTDADAFLAQEMRVARRGQDEPPRPPRAA